MKRYKISAQQFYSLVAGENVKIDKFRTFNAVHKNPDYRSRVFNNIEVKEDIVISGHIDYSLLFENNCIINKLIFTEVNSKHNISLTFKGDTKMNHLRIENSTAEFSINISESSKVSNIDLTNSNLRTLLVYDSGSITILSTFFAKIGTIKLSKKSTIWSLVFRENSEINQITTLDHCKVDFLAVQSNSKTESITLSSDSLEELIVSDSAHLEKLEINNNHNVSTITIENATLNTLILLKESSLVKLELSNNSTLNILRLQDDCKVKIINLTKIANLKKFIITDFAYCHNISVTGKSNLIDIQLDGGVIGLIKFFSLYTESIKIEGSNTRFENGIQLENSSFNEFIFINFKINTGISFLNVTSLEPKKGSIKFIRSDFGYSSFINFKFNSFKTLLFENSQISKSFISNSPFPKNIETNHEIDKISHYKQVKLFYEQLKSMYQNQGNRTEALIYQSKELDAYYETLRWRKKFWDKSTLWAYKWTANFGISWTRAVKALVFVTVPMYIILLWLTKEVSPVWPWEMSKTDLELFTIEYFDFINPTSFIWKRWDFIYELEGGTIRWEIKLFLLLSKIVVISITYQLIQAFRRFGRR
ncbi:hypothetical protein OB69_06915 [Roseivirga seohaensis subsp. aquiponti]|uniref:Uncharacterized protein n=1 Tax=Roseivirga seohaensis subsp. aquiponti TaxID=1566026 RepID=A0A0L8AMA3_9BACT|nr:hypothetical protein [Roseivirga seohaensis]KOF03598.1 hypothetical protein OB69_06915 [Roseivirga seohaensis subsp. aquiponti]